MRPAEDRRFRHLDDLRHRIFVPAESRSSIETNPSYCYGCSRVIAINDPTASKRGFITSVENERTPFGHQPLPGKNVHWVCPSCFEEFRIRLSFRVSAAMTLDDVFDGPPLGPPIGR